MSSHSFCEITASVLNLNSLDDYDSAWLVFDGLDTFATISFCGQQIASTDNQFRQYAFDVSTALGSCKGDPVLSINFGSAPNIVDAIAQDPNSQSKLKVGDRQSEGMLMVCRVA